MEKNNEKAKMIKSIYSLTPMQEGMLYHNIENKNSTGYVIQSVFRMEGDIEEDYIAKALQLISERYEILRTFIMYEKVSKPVQVVLHERKLEYEVINLNYLSPEEQSKKLAQIKEDDITRGFDLQKDTLLRIKCIKLNEISHEMIWSHHHIIMDGWCTTLIYGDFLRYYTMLYQNNTIEDMRALITSEKQETSEYGDYVKWLEAQDKEKAKAYFEKLFQDYDEEAVIRPVGLAKRTDKQMEKESIVLDEYLTKNIYKLAQTAGVTVNTVMEAAWGVLLQKNNFINDVVFGKVVSGRNAEVRGIENMVGLFINTIPVRVRCTEDMKVMDLIKEIQNQAVESSSYDYCSLADIQSATKQGSDLIKTLFAFENYYINEDKIKDVDEYLHIEVDSVREQTNYEISLSILADENSIRCDLLYNPNDYGEEEIVLILKRLERILGEFTMDSQKQISQLEVITKEERTTIFNSFNNTFLEYDREKSLVEIFEEVVMQHKNRVAVAFLDHSLTYEQLNEHSNRLAKKLIQLGVQNNNMVAIIADRSMEMMIGILGIIKAGAAYVPIDPTYPEGRIRFILDDCKPKVVLTYNTNISTEIPVIELNDNEIYTGDGSNLNIKITSDNLAYCIYTSGTTGKPKGVLLSHLGVSAMRSYFVHEYQVNEEDNVLQFANYIFDASVWEITMSLFIGAKLTIIPKDIISDACQFNQFVEKEGITITLLPPQYFLETDIKNLRILTTGGSAANAEIVNKAKNNQRYVNAYGPTESTVLVTRWEDDHTTKNTKTIPIGKPIPNSRVYIMNQFQLCGIGVAGELCISGDGLAKGYLNNTELTNEKFVKNPFEDGMMYRTGDMARWLEDGNIEYLGRIDEQIKIRGFRVELGEIEQVIRNLNGVRDVAVVASEDVNKDKQLCAYVVSDSFIDFDDLQVQLSKDLPAYMIPSYYIRIHKIPLTRNGKLNRSALPKIEIKSKVEYMKPTNEKEGVVCNAFEKILGLDKVGINDSFYKLGGDSIKAIRVVSKVREAGYEISVRDIMQKQTVKLIAIGIKKAFNNNYEQEEVTGTVLSTPIIKEFCNWKLKNREHFNQSMMVHVGNHDLEEIQQVLYKIVEHHDILRAVLVDNQLDLLSVKESKLYELKMFDFTDGENLEERVEAECENVQSSMDLMHGPLFKAILFKTPNQNELMLCAHHLVVDGVSWRIILEDIETALNQLENKETIKLPQKTASFKAWSQAVEEYKNSDSFIADKEYWKKELQKMSRIKFPFDGDSNASRIGFVSLKLEKEDTEKLLRDACHAFHTSINDLLLASLSLAFNKLTNQKQVLIGLEGHGRESIHKKVDIDRTVGWFTSIYPVVLSCNRNLKECIISNKERLHNIPNHGFGYGLVAEELGNMNIEIYFNYLGEISEKNDGLSSYSTGSNVDTENGIHGAIDFNGIVDQGELGFSIAYNKSKVLESTIERLGQLFKESLLEISEYCLCQEYAYKTQSDYSSRDLSFYDLEEINQYYLGRGYVIQDVYSLTSLQSGMLFHHMLDSRSTSYVIQNIFELRGKIGEHYIRKTLDIITLKYSILRTSIIYKNIEKARQVVLENRPIEYESIEIDDSKQENLDFVIQEIKDRDLDRGFNLENESLIRVKLIKLGYDTYKMIWTYHHIIMDGWCIQMIMGDFLQYYKDLEEGKEELILERMHEEKNAKASFGDYIQWLEVQERDKGIEYFENLLADYEQAASIPPLGYEMDTVNQMLKCGMNLEKEDSKQILDLAKDNSLTINTILETAYGVLLQRYNYVEDVVFGKIVSGRNADIKGIEEIAGLFINTIAIRVKNTRETTVKELLENMKEQAIESSKYDYCSLSEIRNDESPVSELIKTLFVFENYYVNEEKKDYEDIGFSINLEDAREQTNYDISICTKYSDDKICFDILYNPKKYTSSEVQMFLLNYKMILKEMLNKFNKPVSSIEMITQEDTSKIVNEFNNTVKIFQRNQTFIKAFEEQVQLAPDNTAVTYNNESITYKELNDKANFIADLLRAKGVKVNDFVAVKAKKSIQMIVAILGVIKSSAAYVPIDVSLPKERMEGMIEDCKPKAIITYDTDEEFSIPIIDLSNEDIYNGKKENFEVRTKASDLLYLLYTSGTTGKPKGVMVENRGIINLRDYFRDAYGISSNDKVLQFANICFDASIWEITMALLNGAELVIPTSEQIQSMELFSQLIRDQNVSIATLPPVYYAQVDTMDIRIVITAGAEANQEIVRRTKQRYIHAYGPTENTVCATHWEYNNKDKIPKNIPIGKPINNVQVYIMNGDCLCGIGVPGELCIAGEALARGYLNMPELTEKKFVLNPYGEGVLYRSGDLARWLDDGNIEFMGRIDEQVKIRGYRIELGEIEYGIRSYEGVSDAAVVVIHDKSGEKSISAYYVAQQEIDNEKLREFLAKKLPSYMLPTYLIMVEKIPLTRNGKLDKKALPSITEAASAEYVKPRNELDSKICTIIQEVTGYEKVGINDNIFELGVNSLKAIGIIGRMKRMGIELPIQIIFDLKTASKIADYVQKNNEITEYQESVTYDKIHDLLSANNDEMELKTINRDLDNILLTGATGFLGAHLLAELIENGKGKVFCLIRSNNEEEGEKRLIDSLNYYFGNKYDSFVKDRIFVISGSIEQEEIILKLPRNISTVIHTAALTKHYGFKEDFYKVNVQGTNTMLNYAETIGARFVYISTTSVAGEISQNSSSQEFSEMNYYIGQTLSKSEYTVTKFQAEKLVLDSKLKGHDNIIIRVGNLTNRFSDGKPARDYEGNRFLNMIKLVIEQKNLSRDLLETELQLTPVDDASKGIIQIVRSGNSRYSIYHLIWDNKIKLQRFINHFSEIGIQFDVNEDEIAICDDRSDIFGEENFEQRVVLEDGIGGDMIHPEIKCKFTNSFLHKVGFYWNEINDEYLSKMISCFYNNGFWRR